MRLSGLHLLLTYQCTFECDHCFVWGSPFQVGTMRLDQIRAILAQARELSTVRAVYFEGGEPFLYHPVLVRGAVEAAGMGFEVGLVTNAYWATSLDDALVWLEPFAGIVHDLTISADLYHSSDPTARSARTAAEAAARLAIPLGTIRVAQPEGGDAGAESETPSPPGESTLMFRGRAVANLASRAAAKPAETFTSCPFEDLRDPGRVHVDPLGNVHLCQGITIGNLFERPLRAIVRDYDRDPLSHPVAGPLLAGGPRELAVRYAVPTGEAYADACHMCYEARVALRARFPEVLGPDQMYGVIDR